MLTDHAILLAPENVDTILRELPTTREVIEELIDDINKAKEGEHYVVFYRLPNGHPTWVVLTPSELKKEYSLETLDGRFERKFEKIL